MWIKKGVSSTLSGLDDVSSALPNDGQILGYDVSFGEWKPKDIPQQSTVYYGGGINASSNLKRKVYVALGDSITEKNFRTDKNYHDYIALWSGCVVKNYGISGTGWFVPGSGQQPFYNRISGLDASADIITVFGGTNDWAQVGKSLVLGSFGDTDGAVSFYGAVDSTITQLITKYPTKTIAVFTPLPRDNAWAANSAGITLEQVSDAIIKVCNKYSIPVLDLYRKSGLAPWNATANATLFSCASAPNGDGLHPNATGHQIIAYKILDFLQGIVGTTLKVSTTGSQVIFSDTFDRTNDNTGLGNGWVNLQGVYGISTNRAAMVTGTGGTTYDLAVKETGIADCIVEATTYLQSYTGLMLRVTDSQNFILFRNGTGNKYELYKSVAGTLSGLAPTSNVSYAQGDKMKAVLDGSAIRCYVNDVLVFETADPFNINATQHGIGGFGTSAYSFDDFKVSAL